MVWVVKFKDGAYDGEPGAMRSVKHARKYDSYGEAVDAIGMWERSYRERVDPRIVAVRLKPRAKLDEAAIRADERIRIASALAHEIKLPFAFQPGSPLDVPQLRARIIAFDWPAKP